MTGAPPECVDQHWAANCHWGVDDGEQALMHSSWQMKGSQLQRRQQSLSMNFALPEKTLKACRTNWRDRAQLLPACLVCSLSLSLIFLKALLDPPDAEMRRPTVSDDICCWGIHKVASNYILLSESPALIAFGSHVDGPTNHQHEEEL